MDVDDVFVASVDVDVFVVDVDVDVDEDVVDEVEELLEVEVVEVEVLVAGADDDVDVEVVEAEGLLVLDGESESALAKWSRGAGLSIMAAGALPKCEPFGAAAHDRATNEIKMTVGMQRERRIFGQVSVGCTKAVWT